MKTLREVAVGSSCTVKKLHGEGAVKRRIMDMGITKGVEIKVQKVAPFGWVDGAFGMLAEDEIGNSMLAAQTVQNGAERFVPLANAVKGRRGGGYQHGFTVCFMDDKVFVQFHSVIPFVIKI